MKKKKIVIIGGSAAGPKAAARARRLDQNAEILIIQKDSDLSMASCGYPYYVGGVFDNRDQLLSTPTGVIRNPKFFLNAKGITAFNNTEAVEINRKNKVIKTNNIKTNEKKDIDYDKLILCTGSNPKLPPIPGIDLEGITTLQSIKDADYLRKIRDEKKIKKAVVIGGGLIGIETGEALNLAGIDLTVIEMQDQILPFLDKQLAKIIENHIKSKGANVITGNGINSFLGKDGKLTGIKLKNGTELDCELAVVAIGVKPNTDLALKAGLEIGEYKGITVNSNMQTSDPDIYAAGDCIETVNAITGDKAYMPMGDLANLQGRVAGENVVLGNNTVFGGTYKTGICKVFDFNAGSTGINITDAEQYGFKPVTTVTAGPDKPGFMGSRILINKIIADEKTGRLIGFQCVGSGDVSKQIAQAAIAIQGKLTVDDLSNSDLPYAPPFTLAIDNFIAANHVLQNKIAGRMSGISCRQVKEKVDNNENILILDTRGSDEYEIMRLGIGETLMPLGSLRDRINELPDDKNTEIVCYCKISLRGYEAARIIEANGYTNVKVMEGGIMAWPYPREK
ncbi:MAG: FAD-dependent oxidoreductase [Spirochaetes bacterium]|nr:FAD-dependent oxidoreductase [Spirochaetota bacterium]